jgi:hypothetical protein
MPELAERAEPENVTKAARDKAFADINPRVLTSCPRQFEESLYPLKSRLDADVSLEPTPNDAAGQRDVESVQRTDIEPAAGKCCIPERSLGMLGKERIFI